MLKSQVTIYVIAGLLVLIVGGIIFTMTLDLEAPEPIGSAAVKLYVDECLKQTGIDAFYELGAQGRLYPDHYLEGEEGRIAYYYYKGDGLIPTDVSIYEEDISRYIDENIRSCLRFESFEYDFEFAEKTVSTNIHETDAVIDMEYEIIITSGETSVTLTDFNAELDFDFLSYYYLAKDIYLAILEDPEYVDLVLLFPEDFDVTLVKINDSILVYELRAEGIEGNPYLFRFAVNYGKVKGDIEFFRYLEKEGRIDPAGDEVLVFSMPFDPEMITATPASEVSFTTVCDRARGKDDLVFAVNANPADPDGTPNGIAGGFSDAVDFGRSFTGVFAVYEDGEAEIIDLWDDVGTSRKDSRVSQILARGVETAVSCQPVTVKDCQIQEDSIQWYEWPENNIASDNNWCYSLCQKPRTAIALDGDMVHIAIFKRASLMDEALFFQNHICSCPGDCTVLNLDGGGSTTLYVNDESLLREFDTSDRCVYRGQEYYGDPSARAVVNSIEVVRT